MDFKALLQELEAIENTQVISEAVTLQQVQEIEKMAARQAAMDKAKGGWKAFTTFDPVTAGNVALADLADKAGLPGLFNSKGEFVVATSKRMDGQTGGAPQIAPPTPADWQPLMKLGLVPQNAQGPAGLTNLLTGGKAGQEFDQVKKSSAQTGAKISGDAFIKDALFKLSTRMFELERTLRESVGQRSISKELVESFGYQQTDEGVWSTIGKAIPGLGLAAGGYDAYRRAQQGDYTGAALSGAAGLAGMIPGVGTAASLGLAGYNAGRDKARTGSFFPDDEEIKTAVANSNKPTQTAQSSSGQAGMPASDNKLAKLQKIIGANPDGIMGPETAAKLKAWQQKKGIKADGMPGPETYGAAGIREDVAESMANLRNKLILLERSQRDYSPDAEVDEGIFDVISGLGRGAVNVGKNLIGGLRGRAAQGTTRTADELAASQAATNATRVAAGKKPLTPAQLAQQARAGIGTVNPATRLATGANRTGQAIANNPVKTGLATAAAAGGVGYLANRDSDAGSAAQQAGTGSSGQGAQPAGAGSSDQAAGGNTTSNAADAANAANAANTANAANAAPEKQLTDKQKELIKEIQAIMSQLADIEDQEVFTELEKAQNLIDRVNQSVAPEKKPEGPKPSDSERAPELDMGAGKK